MNISFLDAWRKRHSVSHGVPAAGPAPSDPEGVTQLLSECGLLRAQAQAVGMVLHDTADSLTELDQLLPRWRDDPEVLPWLGNDAGLYLGTVIVRTVPRAAWQLRPPDDQPVIRLASGREIDVVAAGHDWAASGTPGLSQVYAEAAES